MFGMGSLCTFGRFIYPIGRREQDWRPAGLFVVIELRSGEAAGIGATPAPARLAGNAEAHPASLNSAVWPRRRHVQQIRPIRNNRYRRYPLDRRSLTAGTSEDHNHIEQMVLRGVGLHETYYCENCSVDSGHPFVMSNWQLVEIVATGSARRNIRDQHRACPVGDTDLSSGSSRAASEPGVLSSNRCDEAEPVR